MSGSGHVVPDSQPERGWSPVETIVIQDSEDERALEMQETPRQGDGMRPGPQTSAGSSPVQIISPSLAYRKVRGKPESQRGVVVPRPRVSADRAAILDKRPPWADNASDDAFRKLSICPHCHRAWTARKTSKAKGEHLVKCAKMRKGVKAAEVEVDRAERSLSRQPLATVSDSNMHIEDTLLGTVWARQKGRKKQGAQARPSRLLPAGENLGIFASRAAQLVQDARPCESIVALPPPTQAFEPSRVSCLALSPEDQIASPRKRPRGDLWLRTTLALGLSSDPVQPESEEQGRDAEDATPKKPQRPPLALTTLVSNAITQSTALYHRVLLYEPLEINHLLTLLDLPECNLKSLSHALDELSICFWNVKTASQRRKRRHK